ncbi:unnamed protein product [Closterium sp. NIES-53]
MLRLCQMPEEFSSLTSLKTLSLRGVVLPERMEWLSNLETLHVRRCILEQLPASFTQLISMTSLELGHCEIEELPDGLENLRNMQHLNINRCPALRRIPDSVSTLTSLVTLTIEFCPGLSLLPSRLSSLEKLKRLRVVLCERLKQFPTSLPLSLEVLSWKNNGQVASFPQISQPFCLRNLELGLADGVERLSVPWRSLGHLHVLSILNGKRILTLPENIGSALQQLRDLRVCNFEELRELPETVSQLQHLTLLKVLAPKLTSIPDGIGRLSRLRELDLP